MRFENGYRGWLRPPVNSTAAHNIAKQFLLSMVCWAVLLTCRQGFAGLVLWLRKHEKMLFELLTLRSIWHRSNVLFQTIAFVRRVATPRS
jgi:hypothetical protein